MSQLYLFYRGTMKVCATGCVPTLKFNAALQSCHVHCPTYHHAQDWSAWIGSSGAILRMCASKFADMAGDEEVKERCLRKALLLQNKKDWATLETLGVYKIFRVWGIKNRVFRIQDL